MEKPKNNPEPKPIYEEPHIQFKNHSERLMDEYDQLYIENKELYDMVDDIHHYCLGQFGIGIIITMIYRTQEEQDELYKNDSKYKEKKFKSPHQFWQAVDLRSSIFNTNQIENLVNYLNEVYNSSNYYKWTAKCHDIGAGEHFHIQYLKKGE